MEKKDSSHLFNILILISFVVIISLLGYSTVKNQTSPQPSLLVDQPQSSPTPLLTNGLTPTPPSQNPIAGLTLQIDKVANGISLHWPPFGTDAVSYIIYRKELHTNFQPIRAQKSEAKLELAKTGLYEFTDTAVVTGINYTYTISSINIFGQESEKSTPVTVIF